MKLTSEFMNFRTGFLYGEKQPDDQNYTTISTHKNKYTIVEKKQYGLNHVYDEVLGFCECVNEYNLEISYELFFNDIKIKTNEREEKLIGDLITFYKET